MPITKTNKWPLRKVVKHEVEFGGLDYPGDLLECGHVKEVDLSLTGPRELKSRRCEKCYLGKPVDILIAADQKQGKAE